MKINLSRVIVRVGVRDLKCLTQLGCGNIYGRGILSSGLALTSQGRGTIMLMGNMNVQAVNQYGPNSITLFGVNTPALAVRVIGQGNLNLCGQIGVRSIVHNGNGKIDLVGMETPSLTIYAAGSGITQAEGVANLKNVQAYQYAQVYLSWIQSDGLTVTENDHAEVGLAGTTSTLNLDIKGSSRFQGQYLFARGAYAKTHESAHANVNATQKLFLNSHQHSSIYYFSSVKELSTFAADQSIILETHNAPSACAISCPLLKKHIRFKGE